MGIFERGYMKGDPDEEASYRDSAQIEEEIEILSTEGVEHLKAGRLEEAISTLSELLNIDPSNSNAFCNRGAAKAELDRKREALDDFNSAIFYDEDNKFAHYNRGLLNFEFGDAESGFADLNRATEIDPEYVDPYNARGFHYLKLAKKMQRSPSDRDRSIKLLSDAIAELDVAVQIDPANLDSRTFRAYSRYELGLQHRDDPFDIKSKSPRRDLIVGAIEDFTVVLEREDNPRIRYARAKARIELRDYKNALGDLSNIKKQEPNFRDTARLISDTRRKLQEQRQRRKSAAEKREPKSL